MSHNAIQIVSPANTSMSRIALITSVRLQRTSRTFRLLPFPGSMVLGTTASLQDLLEGQQKSMPSLKRVERRVGFS
jgi:hypothetical protein